MKQAAKRSRGCFAVCCRVENDNQASFSFSPSLSSSSTSPFGSFMIRQELGMQCHGTKCVCVSRHLRFVQLCKLSKTKFKQTLCKHWQTHFIVIFLGSNWRYANWAYTSHCFRADTASCSFGRRCPLKLAPPRAVRSTEPLRRPEVTLLCTPFFAPSTARPDSLT